MNSILPLAGCLEDIDPQIDAVIRHEQERQKRKLILIASESISPEPVRLALSCEMQNIYAEGYPSPRTLLEPSQRLSSFGHQLSHYRRYANRRYYKGCEYVDILEQLLRRRTAEVFANENASAEEIFVNTQPLSGAAANNAVYNAFVKPGDTVLGPSLTHGGHLTHGSEVNRSGLLHNVVHYEIARSGQLDYEAIARLARECRPRLLIGGFSAYPWDIDWSRLRAIADEVGAVLLADIAHLAGMVAAGLLNNPVGTAHVVSFTTHKTLCGPRGAMLLSTDPEIARRVDLGVFPGEQGGPHIHQMAAKAVAMKLAAREEFRSLQKRVLENTATLARQLAEQGLTLAYGGTNTHMCLVDLRPIKTANGQPLTGEIASRILDLCGIVCNKNTIHGDSNAIHPSGLRFGTTWASQRGFGPEHMGRLAELIARVLKAIVPFTYIAGRSDRGRGKIAHQILREVRQQVDRLLDDAATDLSPDDRRSGYPHFLTAGGADHPRSSPLESLHRSQAVALEKFGSWLLPARFSDEAQERQALEQGTALLDGSRWLWLELSCGRAGQFLECASSLPALALEVGRVRPGLLLNPDGSTLARVLVARQPDDEFGQRVYLLGLQAEQPDEVVEWLRELSDGYVLHDEDVWIKAEGPVVIEDLYRPAEGRPVRACLALRGPRSRALAGAWLGGEAPAAGHSRMFADTLVIARPEETGAGFDLLVPLERAAAVWSQLVESGARPVGWQVASTVLGADWLPAGSRESELLALEKPFFVGRRAHLADAGSGERPTFSYSAAEGEPRHTCLIEQHRQLASKKHLVPFAGWLMPVLYSGILDEHQAVRRAAGLFDVSHMGVLEFTGSHAERFLDLVTTNYVPMLLPGQAHYSYLLAHDGRCIDDIIVYRLERERFLVVVNAANAEEDQAWLRAVLEDRVVVDEQDRLIKLSGTVHMRDLKDVASCGEQARVDLALQGPLALALLQRLAEGDDFRRRLGWLRKFELCSGRLSGLEVTVARTGYTGEDTGFEIFVHPEQAPRLWNDLLELGSADGLKPCALGARDSLRCEAGFPLHGHELAGPHAINPIEAGYGSYVKLHKPFFPGRRQVLRWHLERRRAVVRFAIGEKGGKVIRAGSPVLGGRKNEYAGVVTSCVSTGTRQVGMALLDSRFAREGTRLQVLPITSADRQPPARTPAELSAGDWMVVPRPATVLSRFASAEELQEHNA